MPSIGQRLGTTDTQNYVLLGALALLGYVVYQAIKGVKTGAAVVGSAASALKSVTGAVAGELAKEWYDMKPTLNSALQGSVLFPDGSLVSIAQLDIREDINGNVYTSNGQGLLFQLQPSNAQGNWPAVQVTDPSQIGQTVLGGATPGGF